MGTELISLPPLGRCQLPGGEGPPVIAISFLLNTFRSAASVCVPWGTRLSFTTRGSFLRQRDPLYVSALVSPYTSRGSFIASARPVFFGSPCPFFNTQRFFRALSPVFSLQTTFAPRKVRISDVLFFALWRPSPSAYSPAHLAKSDFFSDLRFSSPVALHAQKTTRASLSRLRPSWVAYLRLFASCSPPPPCSEVPKCNP